MPANPFHEWPAMDRPAAVPAEDKARRHRLADIAELAGVGIATVDRVLNERGNVSPITAERVLAAARRLKLNRILPSSHRRLLRIEVLLVRPDLLLISRIGREFARLAERIDRSVVIQRTTLRTAEPRLVAEHIAGTKCNAVIVYAPEHPLVDRAIATARARGVPTLTFASDLPRSERLAFCGPDPRLAGRTAGFFVAKMLREPGPVAVLCGSLSTLYAHSERVGGFRDALTEHGGERLGGERREVIVVEGNDNLVVSERLLLKTFAARPDIVALYNAGGANDACAVALRAGRLRRRALFVGHELNNETRPLLQDGTITMVIDQDPEHQARFALDVVMHHFGYVEKAWLTTPYRSPIEYRLHSPENMTESGAGER